MEQVESIFDKNDIKEYELRILKNVVSNSALSMKEKDSWINCLFTHFTINKEVMQL